ncbi:hypothetical protein QBZ16_000980 [Prototheca wickerhamii]|uniref:Pre-mRNA-splicing factor SPF27 n=1 Tax=Prototheca wickerhamii TaxID=3111 RepID=A0AAD9MJF3_PROWI|nr:hypothetical protein QBZ16_000980 [Prototheca wickerhamii]
MPPEVLALPETAQGEERGWRRGQDIIDALPYIDELTPEYRAALSTSSKKPSDYLAELPPEGSFVADLLERVQRGGKSEALDVQRYDLPAPEDESVEAWQGALNNAHSQLEHQYTRLLNLELLVKFGPDSWRARNDALATLVEGLKAELKVVEERTEQVNRRRKLMQLSAGEHLAQLQEQYRLLAAKNREIRAACDSLEASAAELPSAPQN